MITLELCDAEGQDFAQRMVTQGHYLHKPVDPRCSPLAYSIRAHDASVQFPWTVGVLIFGRPEATRCGAWYGSVEDVEAGRCEVTRWQVLNLARVYIRPQFQRSTFESFDDWTAIGHPAILPHFIDRHGVYRSTLVSTAIAQALDRVVLDYLVARPPCFPNEPYQLAYCLSYCDTKAHRGTVYRASGFELYRTNDRGIQTWRKALRPLTSQEDTAVLEASRQSERSRRYRAQRAAQQLAFV